ncbi:MAG TPA: hypothetical protein DCY94_05490 [Firmicutes bacterium]|nr:hypothetical protein [Bacillota bacterium]
MIKNTTNRKSARIDIGDDIAMFDNLSNPYSYNFGSIDRSSRNYDFKRIQNKINSEYFFKN